MATVDARYDYQIVWPCSSCEFQIMVHSFSLQCGDNTTECPPPPEYAKNDTLKEWNGGFLGKLKDVADFLKGNFGKFALAGWFFFMLICLGFLKVAHMFLTGQVDYPALTKPLKLVHTVTSKVFGEYCPKICGRCCEFCQRYSLCMCALTVTTLTGQKDYTAQARDDYLYKRGWRRPRQCDGMCSGAKQARRSHRKQMRINKRKGMKNETAWFQKPYTCTCKVRYMMYMCVYSSVAIIIGVLV